MGLFGRKKKTVGLDIGSGLIKVAVIDHSKREPELVKVAIVPLITDAIVEGEVMDPSIVAEAIQSALTMAEVKTKKVVTAVGGRDVIIKKIQVERVKEQQARELMRWEAEQHVPFDMESVELDFQILDPDAFALHNAFEINHPDALDGIVALVNVGHEVTNVNILDSGVPILTRDITVGTRRLREDLQRERGLTADAADQLLQGFDRSPDLDSVLASRGEEIAVGVERAVEFLASEARSAGQVNALFTCGGGARIPGMTEMLGDRLPIPVKQANPLKNIQVRDDAFDSLVTDEVAPLLMLPIGLALRQVA